MATKQLRRISSNGSAGEKIVSVNKKLGVDGIQNQQGSTRIIYDAVQLVTSASNNIYTLFENCANRQFPLTNLPQNKLNIKESVTVQRISFYIIECASGTTNAIGVLPLGYFNAYQRLYASVFDFKIGQNTVIKKMPLASQYGPLNKDSSWGAMYQTHPAAGDLTSFPVMQEVMWMDNNIVIQPQVEFVSIVTIPPFTLTAGFDSYLAMKIEGLGSLYAPKSTL